MRWIATFILVCITSATGASGMLRQDAAQMDRWLKHMTVGEEHRLLEQMIGEWAQSIQMWMTPGATPTTSKTTVIYESMLGKRFVRGTTTGSIMAMPFNGEETIGYDNTKKQFFSIWLDNFSTGSLMTSGQYDAEKKQIVLEGTNDDVLNGRADVPVRNVLTFLDVNRIRLEMFAPAPDGTMYKTMQIDSTRVK